MANRVVLGAFDGTFVLRVSRPGFNVLSTSLKPSQLVFDSRWSDVATIAMSGTLTMPSSGNSSPVSHGLGYVPIVWVHRRPSSTSAVVGDTVTAWAVNVTSSAFTVLGGDSGGEVLRYFVFATPAG